VLALTIDHVLCWYYSKLVVASFHIMTQGIHEVHITVDVSDPTVYNRFYNYCNCKPGLKAILATSSTGDYPVQLMTSMYESGTMKELIAFANQVAKQMRENNLPVIRVKVESHANNDGVPKTETDYQEWLKKHQYALVGAPYFEFHAKINLGTMTYSQLTHACHEFQKEYVDVFSAVSVNLMGSKKPLMTCRVYNHGHTYAFKIKDLLCEKIKKLGFVIDGQIQDEFSVHDNNEMLDAGWLIPHNIKSKL